MRPRRQRVARQERDPRARSVAQARRASISASAVAHWYIEITLASDIADTRLELNLYPEEWGFVFRRGTRVSSIRVTDIPFVHGFDDHGLLGKTPELERIRLSSLSARGAHEPAARVRQWLAAGTLMIG